MSLEAKIEKNILSGNVSGYANSICLKKYIYLYTRIKKQVMNKNVEISAVPPNRPPLGLINWLRIGTSYKREVVTTLLSTIS